ncbi:hypothetical protein AB0U32_22440, partial [Escherichia coli]
MKIVYTPNLYWKYAPPAKPEFGDVLSLSSNNWDDYGYKTSLNAKIYISNELISFDFSIKLLIENIDNTASPPAHPDPPESLFPDLLIASVSPSD